MLEVETPQDLAQHAGQVLGSSSWFTVTQRHIKNFTQLTGDNHWVHIDVERAKTEMPDGKTIAHGFFILSLIPLLAKDIFKIRKRGKGLNYGINHLRFTAPVSMGSRVRLHQKLLKAEPSKGGTLFTFEDTFEIEGKERPALVTDMLLLIYD
ncbi:enoyl-CoA hydratase [Pollutimonas nitritireducens]|uniref:Enoyl-CoA hydratase n=1 Tax=Pollutimonas nitritireducens TaxID=2045209 RepID=A0A2N4UAV0_9BURK|nr:MaoC family dehydratase [Pollutimonas nitritireducens]PLC52139.1 enoyl-CoA hydratase [Pollutimonas nitritireducens]